MSEKVYDTETRRDGSTYQREVSGIERMERGETIAGLRQVIENDAAAKLDCNWSDDSMQMIAVESLKAIEGLRAALAEALDEWQMWVDDRSTTVECPPHPRIAEIRERFLK